MKTAVIIPTYKRPAYLEKCVESLLKQRRMPEEIIVVARSDNIATRKMLKEYQARAPGSLLIELIEVERSGIVYAENQGLKAATHGAHSLN